MQQLISIYFFKINKYAYLQRYQSYPIVLPAATVRATRYTWQVGKEEVREVGRKIRIFINENENIINRESEILHHDWLWWVPNDSKMGVS